jgi:hypothetical protein
MNIKRALAFGAMLWVAAFMVISIVMFTPWFRDDIIRTNVAWWILEIPVVLLLAKWYFKEVEPTTKNGARLGIASMIVGVALDMIITVPLFVKSYTTMYGDWKIYVGLLLAWVLCIYAGYEFDATYTKPANFSAEKMVEEKEDIQE